MWERYWNFMNIGVKVSIITIVMNFLLFLFKLLVGIFSKSQALISDAIHSLSDVITTFAVIFGLLIAGKDADKNHPYGHERVESVFAIILSFFLFLTGVGIGIVGLKSVFTVDKTVQVPGLLALIMAFISIVVKEVMFHYTKRVAKKIGSSSMEADAWHHRSDALSSVGSFLGILGARSGYPILDPLCSFFIAIVIVKVAIEIFVTAVSQMLDTSCDEEKQKQIIDTILEISKNVDIKDFKTRMFGNKIYVDLDILMNGRTSLLQADKVAKKIHDGLENKFSEIKHCNIHVSPKAE